MKKKIMIFNMLCLLSAPVLAKDGGIVFSCSRVNEVIPEIDRYLSEQNVPSDLYHKKKIGKNKVQYVLKHNISTIEMNKTWSLGTESVKLPTSNGFREQEVITKKEIILSLMHRGRINNYSNEFCNINTFKDSVGIRQNTAAWGMDMDLAWLNEDQFTWRDEFWLGDNAQELKNDDLLVESIYDVFFNQRKYSIGCLAAARLLMLQGILDYYNRVSPNPEMLSFILEKIKKGGFKLYDIDPDRHNPKGKLLIIEEKIPAKNIIPGDWLYFKNPDKISREKFGYEGSNVIYLGNNKFVDFYNSNNHGYTIEEKFHSVYQWRNGVFDKEDDADKVKPIPKKDARKFYLNSNKGGLTQDYRVSNYLYAKKDDRVSRKMPTK